MSRAKGARYEKLALEYLSAKGLKLVEQNFHCRAGEIDLVLFDDECLVFVEVRYRSSNRFACAAETVDERKQAKIARAAGAFLGRRPALSHHPVRFDVVAFDGTDSDQGELQWIRDAFRV